MNCKKPQKTHCSTRKKSKADLDNLELISAETYKKCSLSLT